MQNAHHGTAVVPLNYNSGLLLANDEARVSRVCAQGDVCQNFGNAIHVPAEAIYSMTSLWHFYWGGGRYCGTSTFSYGPAEVHVGCYRLLHQVGGG